MMTQREVLDVYRDAMVAVERRNDKPTFECIRVWVERHATHFILRYFDVDGERYGLQQVIGHAVLDGARFPGRIIDIRLEDADRLLQRSIARKRGNSEMQRFGQPHDFNNPERRCKCGISKVHFDLMREDERRAREICRMPHELKR